MSAYSRTEQLVLLSIRAHPGTQWTVPVLSQWLEMPRDEIQPAIDHLMECGEICHVNGEGYKDAS